MRNDPKNHKNYKKKKYAERERYEVTGGDLSDSNEQEQEKVGFERPMEEQAMRHSEFHSEPSTKSDSEVKSEVNPESEAASVPLPRRAEETEAVQKKEDILPDSPKREQRKPPREESEASVPPREHSAPRRRGGSVLWGVAMVGILLASISVMVFALVIGANQAALLPQELPSDTADTDTSSNKVIFVRQSDDGSGILSAPELYAACSDTVVSILTQSSRSTGVGSGFILTEDGYIGTANHVVAGMERLTVRLSNGEEYPATLVAGNELTDLAVIKIEKTGLPTVTMGSSAELLTGERVYAIGTPASVDYAGSLCSGVVSCAKRTVRITQEGSGVTEKKMTLIQTDAPVNPGNSGCPLFDEYGHVIGVVTMKLGDEFADIGFAIPSDGAAQIFSAMMAEQTLTDELLATVASFAPKLGIVGEARERNGVYGVEIVRFSEASVPAADILKIGDLITKIDDTPVTALSHVSAAIEQKNPGQEVMVTVLRAGQLLTFSVTLTQ